MLNLIIEFKKKPICRIFYIGLCSSAALACWPLYAAEDWSASLKHAQSLLNQGDYRAAYEAYLHEAQKKDNPLAGFSVALFHDLGWGRPKNRAEACRWYQKAAEAKLPAAQHAFADCLLRDVDGGSDPAQAAIQYEKAAEGGHWISLCSLAELYQRGAGVAKDPAKSIVLCESVANQGVVRAMRITASFYLDGDPVTRDLIKGRAWLEQAAKQGDAEAQYRLGLFERDNGQQGGDLEVARFWFESAAAQGYTAAYLPVAELYFQAPVDSVTEKPIPEYLAKAYLWLSAASRRSHSAEQQRQAMEMLGRVNAIMPASWKPELDAKVARHLAAFAEE